LGIVFSGYFPIGSGFRFLMVFEVRPIDDFSRDFSGSCQYSDHVAQVFWRTFAGRLPELVLIQPVLCMTKTLLQLEIA
jgi:hypothetical protein